MEDLNGLQTLVDFFYYIHHWARIGWSSNSNIIRVGKFKVGSKRIQIVLSGYFELSKMVIEKAVKFGRELREIS